MLYMLICNVYLMCDLFILVKCILCVMYVMCFCIDVYRCAIYLHMSVHYDFIRNQIVFFVFICIYKNVHIYIYVHINVFIRDGESSIPSLSYISLFLIYACLLYINACIGDKESPMPPLFLPKAPERNYFLFGQPFDTRDLNIYDKKQCKKIYGEVRSSVEDGIQVKNDVFCSLFVFFLCFFLFVCCILVFLCSHFYFFFCHYLSFFFFFFFFFLFFFFSFSFSKPFFALLFLHFFPLF